ncbi:MAG: NCS2 family permease [Clostridia bacterium]|nr:NCS2 family permease [Clostridia bacterium]
MNKLLKLVGYDKSKGTTVKTELVAGVVTFLAMAYILTVNPNQIVGAGSPYWASVFIATALGAVIGTLLMAFLAKMPLAQASGMGLNSMLGGIIGGWGGYGAAFTPGQGFMLVLVSGFAFLLLSFIKFNGKTVRELVFDGMPVPVRSSISVGIGLFIAFIGFQNAKIIVDDPYVLLKLVDLTTFNIDTANAIVCLVGLFIIAVLDRLNVKGSIIIGVAGATIIGIPLGVTDLSILAGQGDVSWKFWENFADFFAGENSVFLSFTDVFTEGLAPEGVSTFTVVMILITLCMIDMFDTMGTIVGCCGGNRILSDENNKPRNYGKIMLSDAIATCAGAVIGTSTVTTFVESGAGVSAGGRTGLTAFSTATMFFLSFFAIPVFAAIPSAAAAAALIYVGVLMMKNNATSIDFSNTIGSTSAFLTIAVMVLSYSITKGIGVGMIAHTFMSLAFYLISLVKYLVTKKNKPTFDVSAVSIIVSLLFCVYFFIPAVI